MAQTQQSPLRVSLSTCRPTVNRFSAGVAASLLLIPALLFALPGSGQGQQIVGRVASDLDVSPIAGARILLQGTRHQALSDSLGRFTLTGVPGGRYLLVAEAPGFLTVGDSIDVLGPSQGELLVLMAPDPIQMDSLQVVALTDAERRQRAAGASHYVALGREDLSTLDQRGAVRITDLFYREPRLSRWVRHDQTEPGGFGGGLCLQYPRPGARTIRSETNGVISGCRFPATYLDGAYIPSTAGILDEYPTDGLFSIELVPPSEAVYRYGRQAAHGALVITTMIGAAETASMRASISEEKRRHWTYLGVGTAVGIFGAFGYALASGSFGEGVGFNSGVLPMAGVTAFSIGVGEILYRIRRGGG